MASASPPSEQLERGRVFYADGAWSKAYESLSDADLAGPLAAQDLERLGVSAYMLGRVDDFLGVLERVHQRYQEAGEALRAVRSAF